MNKDYAAAWGAVADYGTRAEATLTRQGHRFTYTHTIPAPVGEWTVEVWAEDNQPRFAARITSPVDNAPAGLDPHGEPLPLSLRCWNMPVLEFLITAATQA